MTSTIKAKEEDSKLLADIGKLTYLESHGNCAKSEDIAYYLHENYNNEVFRRELGDQKNIYHVMYYDKQPAGFSKIILDAPHPDIQIKNITKLERLYLLKKYYGLKLGYELFNFNLELSRNNNQSGMWLYVWKENDRAISFYKKTGFKIIGSYDFKISENHSNPNHHMFLEY